MKFSPLPRLLYFLSLVRRRQRRQLRCVLKVKPLGHPELSEMAWKWPNSTYQGLLGAIIRFNNGSVTFFINSHLITIRCPLPCLCLGDTKQTVSVPRQARPPVSGHHVNGANFTLTVKGLPTLTSVLTGKLCFNDNVINRQRREGDNSRTEQINSPGARLCIGRGKSNCRSPVTRNASAQDETQFKTVESAGETTKEFVLRYFAGEEGP